MNQLPESARRRMQSPAMGEHPDADLLTAFAEQALAGLERERVLLHLATCATCREVMSLATPEQVSAEVAAPAAHSWFRWPVLRWTAVAATVIVVGAAVSVLMQRDRNMEVAVPAPQTPAASSVPQSQVQQAGAAQNERAIAPEKKAARPLETKNGTVAGSNQPKLQAAPSPEPRRDIVADGAASPAAKPVEPGFAVAKTKALDSETAKKEMASKDNAQTVEMTAQNAPTGGAVAKLDHQIVADKVAPAAPPAPLSGARTEAANSLRQGAVHGGNVGGLPMALSRTRSDDNTRWHVSSSGAVERSSDGANWEKVEIDPAVTFRAVSSNNGDLWVGGTGGALFHSADGGHTWSRVKVGMEGLWVADTITSVSFSSSRAGSVMTESKALWTTQDSGRSWQRRQ